MKFNLKAALFRPVLKMAMERVGHGKLLGFNITKVARGQVTLTCPYDSKTVGNPLTGVVHGGIIVSLLDTCCGAAAMSAMGKPLVAPTMDLRLDYMHAATPNEPIFVSGTVYKTTSSVIFCRGMAWQQDENNPIAHCVATFMRLDLDRVQFSGVIKSGFKKLLSRVKE